LAQHSAPGREVSPAEIPLWIEQLNSDVFIVRERATQRLILAGSGALDALALAADGQELEAATRAVRVLLVLSDGQDEQVAQGALDRLSRLKHRPAERRAAEAVLSKIREEKALSEIVRLGGIEKLQYVVDGENVVGHIHLGESWQGGDEGLGLIRHVRWLRLLSIHGSSVTDAGLANLSGLPSLERIELFGTKATDAGVEALRKSLPHVQVDVRGGALLGVQGSESTLRAEVMQVVESSAAAQAGLVPGDVITKFNDQPVKDFRQLTDYIGRYRPGDKAVLEILREDQVLRKEVTFGKWR
jgi:hypothetical protein